MTGNTDGCKLQDARQAGSSDVFYKPINMKDLITSIDRILGQ
jgi:hypothetical protein